MTIFLRDGDLLLEDDCFLEGERFFEDDRESAALILRTNELSIEGERGVFARLESGGLERVCSGDNADTAIPSPHTFT